MAGPSLKVAGAKEEVMALRGLGDVSEIIEAGGLFGYAKKIGMIT